jgi:hypothetical protein
MADLRSESLALLTRVAEMHMQIEAECAKAKNAEAAKKAMGKELNAALVANTKTSHARDHSTSDRRCEVVFSMTDGTEESFAGTYHQSAFDKDSVVVEFDDGEVCRVDKREVIVDGEYMATKKTIKKTAKKASPKPRGISKAKQMDKREPPKVLRKTRSVSCENMHRLFGLGLRARH